MKKMSIIIPCFNAEKYVDICIEHLVKQSIGIKNIEIILVDDKSTDNTLKKLVEYEKMYPDNIVVIKNESNVGSGGCRNIALKYANSEYLAYCDADDWFDYKALEILYDTAIDTCADVIEFSYKKVWSYESDSIISTDNDGDIYTFYINGIDEREHFAIEMDVDIVCWNKIYRSDLVKKNKIEFLEKAVYQEPPFSQMIKFYINKYVRVDKELYYYYQHQGSMSTKYWEKRFDMIKAYCKFYDDSKRNGIYEKYSDIIDFIFWCGAFYMPLLNMASRDMMYSKTEFIEIQKSIRNRVGNICDNICFNRKFDSFNIIGLLSYNDISNVDMNDIKNLFAGLA